MPDNKPSLCFIGFGEAGQAIAAGLREEGVARVAAWDILFPDPTGEKLKRAADAIGVRSAGSAADAVRGADIVISAVTAAASVDAAQSVKAHLAGTPYVLDINSVSPGRKQETAKLLGDAARYVDVAVPGADPSGPAPDAASFLPARMPRRSRLCSPRLPCARASPGRTSAPRRRSRWCAAS